MGTMNYRLEGMDVPRGRLCFLQNIQPWALQQVFKRPRPCFYQTKCSHSSLSTAQILSLATVTAALVLNPASCSAKGVLATNTILRRYVVTDPEAILRYALPIPSERVSTDQIPIRRVQELLERLGVDLRARGAAGLISGRRDLAKLREILLTQRLDVLLDVPAKKRQRAAEFLSKLEACLTDIQGELGLAYTPRDSGVFPPQIMEMQQTLSDVFTARNSAAKQFNFEGMAPMQQLNCDHSDIWRS